MRYKGNPESLTRRDTGPLSMKVQAFYVTTTVVFLFLYIFVLIQFVSTIYLISDCNIFIYIALLKIIDAKHLITSFFVALIKCAYQ